MNKKQSLKLDRYVLDWAFENLQDVNAPLTNNEDIKRIKRYNSQIERHPGSFFRKIPVSRSYTNGWEVEHIGYIKLVVKGKNDLNFEERYIKRKKQYLPTTNKERV